MAFKEFSLLATLALVSSPGEGHSPQVLGLPAWGM